MEMEVIVGWVLSVLTAFILLAGGVLDILKKPVVIKNMELGGYPLDTLVPFGIIKVMIAILMVIPFTSFIGAVLATGWMGGAIASHVRIKDKYTFQVILPILIWMGYGLRHEAIMRSVLGF